jgi:hypothetical protein
MEKFVKIKDSFDSVVLKRDQHEIFFTEEHYRTCFEFD